MVVGPRELLDVDEIDGDAPGLDGAAHAGARFDCAVQLRAHGMTSPAPVQPSTATRCVARLHVPQRGVAAGQALVMYDGDRVARLG